jgi:iron complex outermembrane recepter protein
VLALLFCCAAEVETVVVTAQRRNEDVQSVPLSVQAFTAATLEDLGIRSSEDIAQYTPNVEIALPSGTGNQPIITIRGIGLNDYDTNNSGPNGVYLDEVYLSAPASQTFATFDLSGIEVLKGPQGTLYGRNTSGGAINFVTNKPTGLFEANLQADYGSFETTHLEGAISGPLAQQLTGRMAFTVNESAGYMHNALTGTDENGANNFATRGFLSYRPTDSLKLLLNVHGGRVDNRPTEYRHIGDLDTTTGAQCSLTRTFAGQCVDVFGYGTPSGFYDGSYNRRAHLRVTNVGSYLRADYDAGSVDLTSISAVEYNDKIHPEDSDASPNRLLEITYGVRSTTISQELRASQQREYYNWIGGLYYLHENLHQNQPLQAALDGDSVFGVPGAVDGVAFQLNDQSTQVTGAGAIFGQVEYSLTPRLKLILGGRYTREHKSFDYHSSIRFQEGGADQFAPLQLLADSTRSLTDSAFSWRTGLNFNFTPDILAYASIATGFKSGDFNGSFLSANPVEIARQLEPVQPEKVTAYEIGMKSALFDRHVTFNAAAFYNDYRDLQLFVLATPVPGGGGFAVNVLDNARRAHTDGVDLQLTAKPITGLTLTANTGLLRTKLDDYVSDRDISQPDFSGHQLPLAPHTSTSLIVDYRLGRLDLQANANYRSHLFFDVANDPYLQQGGYWLENARVAYDFGDSGWEVSAFVHNLSDRHYFTDMFDLTSPFGIIQGVVGVPRTWGVEVNWRH